MAAENETKNVDEVITDETVVTDSEEKATSDENIEAEVVEDIEDETASEESEEESKFFKKKKDKKDLQIEELTDKYKRTFAEFDNFRKRSEKEKAAMYEVGARSIVEKILPTVDDFERGLAVLSEEEKESPFAKGMENVYRNMLTALESVGVKPIEAVGAEFNPDFHNAVMHEESDEYGENIISEEFQKGYTYRDTVVRHSMVKVMN